MPLAAGAGTRAGTAAAVPGDAALALPLVPGADQGLAEHPRGQLDRAARSLRRLRRPDLGAIPAGRSRVRRAEPGLRAEIRLEPGAGRRAAADLGAAGADRHRPEDAVAAGLDHAAAAVGRAAAEPV